MVMIVVIGLQSLCDAKIYPKNICGSVTYISWSSDSVSNLENYLMDECCVGDAQGTRRGHLCTSDTFLVVRYFDI